MTQVREIRDVDRVSAAVVRGLGRSPGSLDCRIKDHGAAVVIEEDDAGLFGQVIAIELHGRVGADVIQAPDVARLFPQNRDGFKVRGTDELLYTFEIFL